MAKAPALKGETLPATADFSDFDQGGVTGFENVKAKDLLIPRLTILQALSPQIQPNKADFIPGATMGDICDVGLGEVFKGGIEVIPCFFATVYLEWGERNSGKGLQANHGTNAAILDKATRDDKGRYILPNGNYIAETATYFVLNLTAGGRRSFLPLTSTALKASRKWLTALSSEKLPRSDGSEYTPPMYFRAWKATPVVQTKGNDTWYTWNFTPGDKNIIEIDESKNLLREAKAFAKEASEGLVAGDVGEVAEENAASGSSSRDEHSTM